MLGLSSLSGAAPSASGRNVLNLNNFSYGTNDYAFIDHVKGCFAGLGPRNNSFSGTAKTWPQVLDANGWPNDAAASGNQFSVAFQIPDPANFAGPYIIDGFGNGQIVFNTFGTAGISMSVNSSSNVTVNSANNYTSTGGASQFSINVTWTGTASPAGPVTVSMIVFSTGGSGFFINGVRYYRSADASDLAAGKIFRSGWKQPIVNLCPSAVRFMNILGGNADLNCRFENRGLPNNVSYCAGQGGQVGHNWTASAVYPAASGTNQYTVGTATPTGSNTKTTSASMRHGELATVRFTNGVARSSYVIQTSGITNANPGVVTTSSPHGYSTGDIIGHYIPLVSQVGTMNATTTISGISDTSNIHAGMLVFGPGIQAGTTVSSVGANSVTLSAATTISGSITTAYQMMGKLHKFLCKITVLSATTYSIQTTAGVNIDTSTYGAYASVPGGITTYQFCTLQVGSGNDRTAYPVLLNDGNTPSTFFGGGVISSGQYQTLYFDKQVPGQGDGSGNPIYGAWLTPTFGGAQDMGHSGDCPIEVCVALVNELNAMSPAHTIGMWMNLPLWGLCSIDPDYSSSSNWAVNAMDVVLNPSSTNRVGGFSALGYSGLTRQNTPVLVVELSNEIWNDNDAKGWLPSRAIQRWPTIIGQGIYQDMQSLRSTCMARDIRAAGVDLSHVKLVIGMWGSPGIAPGDFAGNYAKVFGGNVTANPVAIGDWYTNDAAVLAGGWGQPIANHDGVCLATYFDPPNSYYSTVTGTGTFTDDSAMYNGTNNAGNSGGNYTGAANQPRAITNFVNQVIDAANTGGGESIYKYQRTVMPQFAAAMPGAKVVLSYEGGTDWQTQATTVQGGHTLTANDSAFAIAAINSAQWALAQVHFFNGVNAVAKCYMPSIYTWVGAVGTQRWCYCTPDSYASATEGQALVNSQTWSGMGTRNQALS